MSSTLIDLQLTRDELTMFGELMAEDRTAGGDQSNQHPLCAEHLARRLARLEGRPLNGAPSESQTTSI